MRPIAHHLGYLCPKPDIQKTRKTFEDVGYAPHTDFNQGMYFDRAVRESRNGMIRVEVVEGDVIAAGNLTLPVIQGLSRMKVPVDDISAVRIFSRAFGMSPLDDAGSWADFSWGNVPAISQNPVLRFCLPNEGQKPTKTHLGFFFEDHSSVHSFADACLDDFVQGVTLEALEEQSSIIKIEVTPTFFIELLIGDESLTKHGGIDHGSEAPVIGRRFRHIGETGGTHFVTR